MKRYTSDHSGATRRVLKTGAMTIWLALLVSGPAGASTDPEEPPTAVATALDEALDSWSQFSATADPEVVRSSFVVGGPQWRQFVSEAAGVAVADLRQFTVHEVRLRRLDARTATVWAAVEVSQPGHIAQTFGWDFDFTLQDGRWLVWTVVEADPPKNSVETAEVLARTTAESTSQPATTSAPPTARHVDALPEPPKAAGTRIPALSAWVVVVTVIGVAAAGYVAPRLDRRQQ